MNLARPRLAGALRVAGRSPLAGAHPAAWQSQFRGCPGMACSAAACTVTRRTPPPDILSH